METQTINTLQQLLRLSKRCGHLMEERLAPLGLTRSQARTLCVLTERNDFTARDLLGAVNVEPASMTRLLQGLERDGLIERYPHPTDGRAAILGLTDRGRAVEREVIRVVAETNASVFAPLDPVEVETFCGMMGRLSDQVEALAPRRFDPFSEWKEDPTK